jgi:hypothetical protein
MKTVHARNRSYAIASIPVPGAGFDLAFLAEFCSSFITRYFIYGAIVFKRCRSKIVQVIRQFVGNTARVQSGASPLPDCLPSQILHAPLQCWIARFRAANARNPTRSVRYRAKELDANDLLLPFNNIAQPLTRP